MLGKISERPVVFWGTLTSLISALIALGLLFGWMAWSGEQIGGVMLVIAIIGQFLTFFVERQVTPLVAPRNALGQILTP